jgi:putative transposase
MARQAATIVLEPQVRKILECLKRSRTLGQHLAERVRIVLMSAAGMLCSEQAAQLEVDAQRVCRWRKRWAEKQDRLSKALAEGADAGALKELIIEQLSDEYRSGSRGKFSAEQVAGIIALACEDPVEHHLPVSHWTPQELEAKAKERGLVESISPRQVGRFLKGGTAKTAHVAILAQCQASRPARISGAGECRM